MIIDTIKINLEMVTITISVVPMQRPETQVKAKYLKNWFRKINRQAIRDKIG